MEFEIAKKLEKLPANLKGNSLRSIKADNNFAQMIIVADSYGTIKSEVESFRMLSNADISFRMRGKSIDISVKTSENAGDAINNLMRFAKRISFNSEDAMDVIEFWNSNMPLEGCEFSELEMDQNRLRIVLSSESFNQEAVMEKLDPYSMGILK